MSCDQYMFQSLADGLHTTETRRKVSMIQALNKSIKAYQSALLPDSNCNLCQCVITQQTCLSYLFPCAAGFQRRRISSRWSVSNDESLSLQVKSFIPALGRHTLPLPLLLASCTPVPFQTSRPLSPSSSFCTQVCLLKPFSLKK